MNWLRRMMYGRNGIDPLGLATVALGMIILLAAQLANLPLLGTLYYLCGVVFFFRVLSRNIYKRRSENLKFVTILNRVKAWFQLRIKIIRELPTFRYLKCPHCRQRLRVPRGKGRINIRCQKCGNQFLRKV